MSIVTQYGVRVTDRVVITESSKDGTTIFSAKFDGEDIPGYSYSGAGAARIAKAWLEDRQRAKEAAEAVRHRRSEDQFIEQMADKLGVDVDDLLRLLDIVVRRAI